MVKERTTAIGKPVETAIFYGESLVKTGEEFNLLAAGVTDMCSMMQVEQFVAGGGVANIMQMPFLFQTTMSSTKVALDLYEKYPEFREQYSKAKLMWFQPTGPAHGIYATKKQIKTLEDLKGMKTRSGPTYGTEIVEALGGIALDVDILEIYIALERGLLDYVPKDWEACMAFKWFEVTPYKSVIPRGIWSDFLVTAMNWDTWNSLPPDVQEILEELNGRFMSEYIAAAFDNADAELRGVITGIDQKKGNPPLYEIQEDEFQRWVDAVQPVYDKWIEETEDQGLPGRAIFEEARQLAEKYAQ